jgi:hypothetical protein
MHVQRPLTATFMVGTSYHNRNLFTQVFPSLQRDEKMKQNTRFIEMQSKPGYDQKHGHLTVYLSRGRFSFQ